MPTGLARTTANLLFGGNVTGPREAKSMDHFISPEPPHHDVRHALAADLQALTANQHDLPMTIAETVDSSSWLAPIARDLVACVGSIQALESLDGQPHPVEALDLAGVDAADTELVSHIVELIVEADLLVSPEMITIIHRLITRLAEHPDKPLRRRTSPPRIAAAIVWLAFSASGLIGRRRGMRTAGSIWSDFGISSAKDIGFSLAKALHDPSSDGLPAVTNDASSPPRLGDPALLHSHYRRSLINRRQELEVYIVDQRQSDMNRHPIQIVPAGGVRFATNPTTVRWAVRSPDEQGRATVMVATGDLQEMRLTSISVPDARRLIAALEHALSQPLSVAS